NDKIHRLNRHAGFVYQGEIQLPHKRAALAFCSRAQFAAACAAAQPACAV
ncbi:N-acetyltransferase, partial [Pseudomonas sp. MWU12-2534b]